MTDASDGLGEGLDIPSSLIEQIQVREATAGVDELYRAVAGQLPPDQQEAVAQAAGIKLPSPAQIGKAFQDKIMPHVKDGICRKAKYCKHRGLYETGAAITALAAKYTAGAITVAIGVPIPFVGEGAELLVDTTALVLKNGLNKLCECPG